VCLAAIGVTVVLVHADLLFSPHTCGTVSVFFGDADVLAGVAVVAAGRVVVRSSDSFHTIPFSALDSRSLLSLDFGGFGSLLLVLVGTREDAERDTVGVDMR